MKEQRLSKKIEDQAKLFKSRAAKSPEDRKRHDLIRRDEQKWMWTAYNKLGWSYAKIGSVFDRDPRTVATSVKKESEVERKHERQDEERALASTVLVEAKRKHFEQIASLLVSWGQNVERACQIRAYAVTYDVEREPLFRCVLQHCPSVNEKYQNLKPKRQEFEGGIGTLAERIANQAPPEATEWFSKTAAYYSVEQALERTSPSYNRAVHGDVWALYVGEDKVIAEGNPEAMERCEERHKELIRKYVNSPEVSSMVNIVNSANDTNGLRDMPRELTQAIENSRLRQEWIDNECDCCPGKSMNYQQ